MMKDAKELISTVLTAHGGVERWSQFSTIHARLSLGGITWAVKGHEAALADTMFTGSLKQISDSWSPIFEPHIRSDFDGVNIRLESIQGNILEELPNARSTFEGHQIMTPWSRLQLAYFSSYATWNYLNTPFIFIWPGFEFLEMEPWKEKGETWRRLQVIFPHNIPTHSKKQIFYFSEDGLMKRHDYWPEVLGNNSATHIFDHYQEFQGIKFPTSHRIYPLDDADNSYVTDPLLVSIDVKSIELK